MAAAHHEVGGLFTYTPPPLVVPHPREDGPPAPPLGDGCQVTVPKPPPWGRTRGGEGQRGGGVPHLVQEYRLSAMG